MDARVPVEGGASAGLSRSVPGGSRQALPWVVLALREASDGSVWAATRWGALRLRAEGAVLYTDRGNAAVLRVLAPEVEVRVVPDGVAPAYAWHAGMNMGIVLTEGGAVRELVAGAKEEEEALRAGDRITAVDGSPEVTLARLTGPVGTQVRVTVEREGQDEPFDVVIPRREVKGVYHNFWVSEIFEDRDGGIWLGMLKGEIVHYDARRGAWRLYTDADGMEVGFRPRLAQTRDGAIWTVSDPTDRGVNRLDPPRLRSGQASAGSGQAAWAHFRVGGADAPQDHTSILMDGEGTLWIGGKFGLHALRDGQWRVYGSEDVPLPGTRIYLLRASDGALWLAGLGSEALRLDCTDRRWATYEGLTFECETPDGSQWFLHSDSTVVRHHNGVWTRYGVEDGLMGDVRTLLVTRAGVLWAGGSHDSTAATATFDGEGWRLRLHPNLSVTVYPRGLYETMDGSVWVGGHQGIAGRGHRRGLLRYDGETWTQYTQAESVPMTYGLAQISDGTLWSVGGSLARFDGETWAYAEEPEELTRNFSDVAYATREGHLWVGHRFYGAFHYDGETWTRYDMRHGLADNGVVGILQTRDGSIWAATGEGVSRFDGKTWRAHALPAELCFFRRSSLRQSRDGAVWMNRPKGLPYCTIRYRADVDAPETAITLSPEEVSQPGNTPLAWTGSDRWGETPNAELEYAWRLDGGAWSAFSQETSCILQALPGGEHAFEVRARDRDFNEDATPALTRFTVVPPVWREPWFLLMVAGFVGVTGFQASRIVVRDRKLRQANSALSEANRDLFSLNRDLDDTNRALRDEMAERERLDTQLQDLRYLYRLRSVLSAARSAQAAIRRAGKALMLVLNAVDSSGVVIEHDGRSRSFGSEKREGKIHYRRPLTWGERERGHLHLFSGIELSESQERALLDETAGQISRVLEARELELQILQSARLVSLGELAAGVAHELNQPLSVISTTAGDVCMRLFKGKDIPPEELREMMKAILRVVDRMEGTIGHMRVFSRDASKEPPALFSMNDAVQDSLKMIGRQLRNHGIDLVLELAEGLRPVRGHSQAMEQVFLNLFTNARDTLDERGAAEEGFKKRLVVRMRCEDYGIPWVIVEVADNGVGMGEAEQERAFEPFYTTKEPGRGTGLGLSISYAIVQNHNGRIDCESGKGEGTTFRVALPASEKEV